MNKYFIREQNETKGPFSIKELETKNVTKDTWIWREGLENWVQMKELKEFEQFLSLASIEKKRASSTQTIKTVRKAEVPITKNWLFRTYLGIGLVGIISLTAYYNSSSESNIKQNVEVPYDAVETPNFQNEVKPQESIDDESMNESQNVVPQEIKKTISEQSTVEAFIEKNSAPKSHPKQNALDAFIEQNGSKQKTKNKKTKTGSPFMDDMVESLDFNEYIPKPKKDPTFVGPEQVSFR